MARKISIKDLLAEHGMTYAEAAGITLRDKPAPLYQLLVLTTLSSARISADTAVATARELFDAGWKTPDKMRAATWQQRVDALGRGGYRRYDESTATALDDGARYLQETYRGDLRRARGDDIAAVEAAISGFPRIGPTGAGIFCREVQAVWPEVRPYFDKRALDTAGELGYPTDPGQLADLVPGSEVAHLAAALVRAA